MFPRFFKIDASFPSCFHSSSAKFSPKFFSFITVYQRTTCFSIITLNFIHPKISPNLCILLLLTSKLNSSQFFRSGRKIFVIFKFFLNISRRSFHYMLFLVLIFAKIHQKLKKKTYPVVTQSKCEKRVRN